jgi:1-deoxy-D-xylulose-5-phosphate reductoisomerase
MMNKGLEVIEAHYLFGLPDERVEILVHPQSAVHGIVAFRDGSMLAQMGAPDMRTPIAHCLAWPERTGSGSTRLDLAALGTLSFERPDPRRFPALRIAREALAAGCWATNIMNAANEVAVEAFLRHRIGFLEIAELVEETVLRASGLSTKTADSTEAALELDREGRRMALELMEHRAGLGIAS